MGCFLGCFGAEKNHKRRQSRTKRTSPQIQRNRVQNVHHGTVCTGEATISGAAPRSNLVADLRVIPMEEEKLSASPRKRVAFSSNVTTFEHSLVKGNIESLLECNEDVSGENQGFLKETSPFRSLSEADASVKPSIGLFPPNHRYHNARDSDDEDDVYGNSDLDDIDDDDVDDCNEHIDYESVLTSTIEPKSRNSVSRAINEEKESCPLLKFQPPDSARSDHVDSVLNSIENITPLKAAKPKGMSPSEPQKKLTTNYEASRISSSSRQPTMIASLSWMSKSDHLKDENQDIAVDSSLATWLDNPEFVTKKTSSCGHNDIEASGKTMSKGSTPPKNFEDRPILGALTVEELRQMSATSSPRKSPSQSPEEHPIIGSVGTYWNHSASATRPDSASSYRGLPNTTSKYREDSRVDWHSTPFETRLNRALKLGAAET